jgi:hypothetical protein
MVVGREELALEVKRTIPARKRRRHEETMSRAV